MEEARNRKELEHLELTSGEGLELVPLMKNLTHPLKDPATGYFINANKMMIPQGSGSRMSILMTMYLCRYIAGQNLSSTDVTRAAVNKQTSVTDGQAGQKR